MKMQKVNLNGVWSYCLDDITRKKIRPESINWGNMDVPSNWYLSGLPDHAGIVWFRRIFSINTNLNDKEVWLNFEGVDYFAEIWLNGTLIGNHEGYFKSFRFNITDFIRNGENELLVKVDSPFEEPGKAWPDRKRLIKGVLNHHDCRPGGWHPTLGQSCNTGGIWGNVDISITDKIVIDDIKITTESITNGNAQLRFGLNILNLERNAIEANIRIRIFYKGVEQTSLFDNVILCDVNNVLEYSQAIDDARLWWTWDYGNPDLYQIIVEVEWLEKSTEYEMDFGIRTVRISEEGQLFLNGQYIFLRGTNIIPSQWFSSYQEQEIDKDIELLLDANINAVRVHAHITKSEFYSTCDRAGLLVWQDFPLQWGYINTDEFVESASRQVVEMVDCLYNHPCIYLWCCHNEPPTGSEDFDNLLAELITKKDPSRFVHPCSTFREHPYHGWYSGCIEQFIAIPGGTVPSEFGAQALPVIESLKEMMPEEALWPPDWEVWAYHNFQYDQNFNVVHLSMGDSLETFIDNSQQYQCRYIKYSIESYRRNQEKPVYGLYQFMFVDCWPAITWSVVDYFRRLKPGYETLKQVYQPLLISFDIPRVDVVSGQNIFSSVYLINDLKIGFENAIVEIILEDLSGMEILNEKIRIDIMANSKLCLARTDYLSTQWRIPKEAEPGKVVIRGIVRSCDGKLLSENYENLNIVTTFAREFSH